MNKNMILRIRKNIRYLNTDFFNSDSIARIRQVGPVKRRKYWYNQLDPWFLLGVHGFIEEVGRIRISEVDYMSYSFERSEVWRCWSFAQREFGSGLEERRGDGVFAEVRICVEAGMWLPGLFLFGFGRLLGVGRIGVFVLGLSWRKINLILIIGKNVDIQSFTHTNLIKIF